MTVEERLLFIRAGYSAQDIAAFEQAEQPAQQEQEQPAQQEQSAQQEQPTQQEQPAQQEKEPAWAIALKNSIDEMRKTMQANNRAYDDMGDDLDIETAADNALQQYVTGKAPEKSNNHGGKRK